MKDSSKALDGWSAKKDIGCHHLLYAEGYTEEEMGGTMWSLPEYTDDGL